MNLLLLFFSSLMIDMSELRKEQQVDEVMNFHLLALSDSPPVALTNYTSTDASGGWRL